MRSTPTPPTPTAGDASPPCSTPWVVQPVPPNLRVHAAGALATQALNERESAGRRFLEAASAQGLRLSRFWCSMDAEQGRIRHACVLVPAAGRTALLFVSSPGAANGSSAFAPPEAVEEVGEMVEAMCRRTPGPLLAQALLESGQSALERSLARAGFTRIAELQYLRRDWPAGPTPEPPSAWPEGVEIRPWRRGDDDALAEALDASYEATLDCPELHGLRRTADVIDSHRATGRWDPRLWWLVFERGRPRGALLLNPCPEHANTELVYLGLAPSLRGQGLASRLLAMGVHALRSRRHRTIACAVDARNAPARRLYEGFGFRPFAQRVALVRALPSQGLEG